MSLQIFCKSVLKYFFLKKKLYKIFSIFNILFNLDLISVYTKNLYRSKISLKKKKIRNSLNVI